jgi:hypothetical protein
MLDSAPNSRAASPEPSKIESGLGLGLPPTVPISRVDTALSFNDSKLQVQLKEDSSASAIKHQRVASDSAAQPADKEQATFSPSDSPQQLHLQSPIPLRSPTLLSDQLVESKIDRQSSLDAEASREVSLTLAPASTLLPLSSSMDSSAALAEGRIEPRDYFGFLYRGVRAEVYYFRSVLLSAVSFVLSFAVVDFLTFACLSLFVDFSVLLPTGNCLFFIHLFALLEHLPFRVPFSCSGPLLCKTFFLLLQLFVFSSLRSSSL